MGERVTVYEIDDEGWAWGQLADDGYVGWLPANALMRAARGADAQGDGAAHARVSRTLDQAAAGRDAAARQPRRGDRASRIASRSRRSAFFRRAISRRSIIARRISSPWRSASRHAVSVGRQDQSRPRLLRPRAGRADRLRHPLPARQRHAGACARHADRDRFEPARAATWCSGKATWRSCATARRLVHANAFHMAVAIEPTAEGDRAHQRGGQRRHSVKRL